MSRSDRILPLTRLVSALVLPFLLAAFLILFVSPQPTGRLFAWDINPRMTAAYMGAGYLGGAYLLSRAAIGSRWHRVAAGFPPVAAFTIALLLATIIHWDRFELTHIPFLIWLVFYIVTPVLILAVWFRNRATDPGELEPQDAVVPPLARWALAAIGVFLLIFAATSLAAPSLSMQIWPWELTPLTARVMGGWAGLLAVGGLFISREERWSAWRIGVQSILLWHSLVLLGAAINRSDFQDGNLLNWYLISVFVMLVGLVSLYLWMETLKRKNSSST
jgi:hypothetical protein